MKRIYFGLVLVGLLLAVPGTADAKNNSCKLDGLWYGFNTAGEDFVMTITNTGGRKYTALVINPTANAQGEFIFKRRGKYETTWLAYADGLPYGFPGKMLAVYMTGEMEMTGCDSWVAITDWYVYAFNPGVGEDPFVDGDLVNTWPDMELYYKRLP
jgi:hypothetical protein